jgi:hypothetical protein
MMDAAELRTFAEAVRQAAHRHAPDFDRCLEEVGWREALADDPAAARAVFAIQGELNLASSALDDVLLRAMGRTPTPDTAVVVLPGGVGTRRLSGASETIVVQGRLAVSVPQHSLRIRPVRGVDPDGGWVEVATIPDRHSAGHGELVADAAIAAGHLALATELSAAAQTMLDLARRHALDRVQFGRPIAGFQAVRHRLADSLVAIASADAAVDAAWRETTQYTATMAKAIAGRSARTVARHAQQVLAGIGFTSEHPFHLYLRRVLALDQLLGSASALSEQLGAEALRTRRIPPMLGL